MHGRTTAPAMTRSGADQAGRHYGYNAPMFVATLGVRELRDGLSRHLSMVREGTEIVVTDHGTPIARIVPYARESGLDALVREGLVTFPEQPRRTTYPAPVEASGTVSDLVVEQRR